MHVQITIKLTPESREEMIQRFPGLYREFREYIEYLQASEALPRDAHIRWLLESGRWD